MRIVARWAAVAMLAACGCGDEAEKLEPVPLDKLPAGSLAEASKALPGVTFDRARKAKLDGKEVFELIGKDKRGKVREVEVSTEGKVVAVE